MPDAAKRDGLWERKSFEEWIIRFIICLRNRVPVIKRKNRDKFIKYAS